MKKWIRRKRREKKKVHGNNEELIKRGECARKRKI